MTAKKKGEHSQTVHYSGFLDMAARNTWPHSTLEKKKKEQSLSVSIMPFDLSMHAFFFYLRGLMLTLAAVLKAVIKPSFHYRFTNALCAVTCG